MSSPLAEVGSDGHGWGARWSSQGFGTDAADSASFGAPCLAVCGNVRVAVFVWWE